MTRTAEASPSRRRSRDEWLQAALDALTDADGARIRIRDLCASLGVTTGSFYAHFAGRDAFVEEVVRFWHRRYTTGAVDAVLALSEDDPVARLTYLATEIVRHDLGRYDIAIRAWVAHEPTLAPLVRSADRERFGTVRRLFAALGFDGDELEMRTRTFVTFYSMEGAMQAKLGKRARLAEVAARVRMMTRA